jgi:hypothetical protein
VASLTSFPCRVDWYNANQELTQVCQADACMHMPAHHHTTSWLVDGRWGRWVADLRAQSTKHKGLQPRSFGISIDRRSSTEFSKISPKINKKKARCQQVWHVWHAPNVTRKIGLVSLLFRDSAPHTPLVDCCPRLVARLVGWVPWVAVLFALRGKEATTRARVSSKQVFDLLAPYTSPTSQSVTHLTFMHVHQPN